MKGAVANSVSFSSAGGWWWSRFRSSASVFDQDLASSLPKRGAGLARSQ